MDETSREIVLSIHNRERASQGSPDLTWDDSLAEEARSYVEDALNARACNGDNSAWFNTWGWPPKVVDETYGGNMMPLTLSGTQANATLDTLVTDSLETDWLSGKPPYFTNQVVPENRYFDGARHRYRQVVWSSTTSIGCAQGKVCDNTFYMLFCYYSPAGNIPGETALP